MIPIHSYKIMNKEKTYRENHVKNDDDNFIIYIKFKIRRRS